MKAFHSWGRDCDCRENMMLLQYVSEPHPDWMLYKSQADEEGKKQILTCLNVVIF